MPTFGDMCSSCKKDWGKHYDGKESRKPVGNSTTFGRLP